MAQVPLADSEFPTTPSARSMVPLPSRWNWAAMLFQEGLAALLIEAESGTAKGSGGQSMMVLSRFKPLSMASTEPRSIRPMRPGRGLCRVR